jgi:hypothetical protein
VKFKNDYADLRVCTITDEPERVRICIPTGGDNPWIEGFNEMDPHAVCVGLTRKKLRKLAYKILKELK